jgi:hypothetical protein
MKERKRGWSAEMHAGSRTSCQRRNASSAPIPCAVMVRPAESSSSCGVRGRFSGAALASRLRQYSASVRAVRSASPV